MATVRKRGKSYQIRVSCGYDSLGNQVVQTKSRTPEKGMTAKQIEKELNRQMVLFEEECTKGYQSTAVKFQDFAEEWFRQYAEVKLKAQTVRSYHNCEKKVYKAIRHLDWAEWLCGEFIAADEEGRKKIRAEVERVAGFDGIKITPKRPK